MLYLRDVRDWLKEINSDESFGIENFYVGKLDNKKEKSLGVYNLDYSFSQEETYMVGNLSTYNVLPISILIHYNSSFNETEEASLSIYDYLRHLMYDKNIFEINEIPIYCFYILSDCVDVGTDENGIYERVIQIKIYYKGD